MLEDLRKNAKAGLTKDERGRTEVVGYTWGDKGDSLDALKR